MSTDCREWILKRGGRHHRGISPEFLQGAVADRLDRKAHLLLGPFNEMILASYGPY